MTGGGAAIFHPDKPKSGLVEDPDFAPRSFRVWVWDWVALGPPKGLARVTQASRKGDPRVEWNEVVVFTTKDEEMVGGMGIDDIARDRKNQKRTPEAQRCGGKQGKRKDGTQARVPVPQDRLE